MTGRDKVLVVGYGSASLTDTLVNYYALCSADGQPLTPGPPARQQTGFGGRQLFSVREWSLTTKYYSVDLEVWVGGDGVGLAGEGRAQYLGEAETE